MREILWIAAWLTLPTLFGLVAGRTCRLVFALIDWRHPDVLPLSASVWLRSQIERLGLPLRVLPEPGTNVGGSYFNPELRTIVLAQIVFFKPDPGAWATAAHELGHARLDFAHPRLSLLLLTGRRLPKLLWTTALVLLGTNFLYGSAAVDDLVLVLLVTAAALNLGAMLDEALATRDALRLLAEDGRLDRQGLRSARTSLGAAFLSYVADWLGKLAACASFGAVRAVVESRRFVPGPALSGLEIALAVGAIALLAARLVRAARHRGTLAPMRWDLPVLLLAAVVWDQPGLMAPTFLAALSCTRLVVISMMSFQLLAGLMVRAALPKEQRELSAIWVTNVAGGRAEIEAAAREIPTWSPFHRWLVPLALALDALFVPLMVISLKLLASLALL